MKQILASIGVVALFLVRAAAEQTLAKPSDEEIKALLAKCKTTILKRKKWKEPESLKFEKGEKYKNSSIVSFSISEDGSVGNIKLKRSSGVKAIDEYVIQQVKSYVYKPMPGCPGIHSQAEVLIHFQ